jgi:HEAT repeat protein
MLRNDPGPHLGPSKGIALRIIMERTDRRLRLQALHILGLLLISLAVSCASEVDVEKLYVQSNSDDYEERVEARQKIEQLVREGKVEPFARGLRSESAETRVQSLLHLKDIKSQASKEALLGELDLSRRFNVYYNPIRLLPSSIGADSRIMVARIIFLLGGDPRAVEILKETYGKEPDADARVGTLYALGALMDPRTIPVLRKGLRDPELKAVKAALDGLSQLEVPDVPDDLVRGLQDPDERVRKNCASALSGYPGQKAAQALIETVKKDASEEVRQTAMDSLGFAGGADAFQFALGVLKSKDSSEPMKGKAVSALRNLSGQDFGEDAGGWSRWYRQSGATVWKP